MSVFSNRNTNIHTRTFFSSFTIAIFAVLFFTTSAQAHEPRLIAGGALNVVVGWDAEPAFEKTINAFELIVTDPIEVTEIELVVHALYLDTDAPDANIIKSVMLTDTLRRNGANPNQFNQYFLPPKAGAFGFHIIGMINGNAVDETFICRGGSQNADGRSFG